MDDESRRQIALWKLDVLGPLMSARLVHDACELGPRGTGKSHIYKGVSLNSILVSGGQTTVANLFYNLARRQIGLVGMWDVVAFDEVAGIRFKDQDGVQIMKDFMASGSFVRGRDSLNASAAMVFVGNIDNVTSLLKTSHLLAPFPDAMIDSAFFDRFHSYIPGWEIPKMRPEFFTDQYGFIVDYLAEFFREMRKYSFGDAISRFFQLGRDLNQRDTIAVKRTVSGLLKLLYPHEEYDKEAVRECLEYALEARRRIKEHATTHEPIRRLVNSRGGGCGRRSRRRDGLQRSRAGRFPRWDMPRGISFGRDSEPTPSDQMSRASRLDEWDTKAGARN